MWSLNIYSTAQILKDMLYKAYETSLASEDDSSVLQRHYAAFQEKFFQMCDKEVTKVNTFHAEKLAEAHRRFITLEADLDVVMESQEVTKSPSFQMHRRSPHRFYTHRAQHKTLCDLKLAFSELYLSLVLLQNYQNLNYMGFGKITEKYDKLFGTQRGSEWKMLCVDTSPFYTSKKNDQLIQEVESLFTNRLEGGNRYRAMKRLRVPPLGAAQPAPFWTTFRVGVFTGLAIAFTLLISMTVFHTSRLITLWPLLRLYRGGFLIIEFIFLLGINNYGWRKAGVNHILIFELDPRANLSYFHLFEYKVASAPFHKVGFADFWLADQLNSLSPVFVDSWALCCYYILDVNWQDPHSLSLHPPDVSCTSTYPLITSLLQCVPPWIRFAQCLRRYWDSRKLFPHLVNAGKYSTVFIMVTFASLAASEKEWPSVSTGGNFYFYAWIAAACVGTLFTTMWDLKMDWGVLEQNSEENLLLRGEMVYPKKGYYYCAMAGDVLLRISWAANIFYAQDRYSELGELLTFVLGPLEVFRRFIWNFFRLENEHLNNCGQFRAVRDISIAPLHVDSQTALEHLMDQEDGATNHLRGRRISKKNTFSLKRSKRKARETRVCVEGKYEDSTNSRFRNSIERTLSRSLNGSLEHQE